MKKSADTAGQTAPITIEDTNPNQELNRLIREVMGRRTASRIAGLCGVSVSTITRIRNGENKRGVQEEFLLKIWQNRDPACQVSLEKLMLANQTVSEANRKKEDAEYKRERFEMDDLWKQIPTLILNSGAFIRKLKVEFELIPGEYYYPEAAYEIGTDNGNMKTVLFLTQFYSKRQIEQREKWKAENPAMEPQFRSQYRSVLEFQEIRRSHSEHDAAELIILFNYEDAFRYNAERLTHLSQRDHVTLALMGQDSRRFLEEICLDGREKGLLSELGLIRR